MRPSPGLRPSLRFAGGVVLLAALAPRTSASGSLAWPWQAGIDALPSFDMALCAAALVLLTFRRSDESALAVRALGIAGIAFALVAGHAFAGARLGVGQATPGIASAGLVGAALHLGRERWRVARSLLMLAALAAAVYYVWPTPREGPLALLGRALLPVMRRSSPGQLLSACVLAGFVVSPSVIPAFGWLALSRGRSARTMLAPLVGLHAMPVLLLPFVTLALGARGGSTASLVEALAGTTANAAMLVWIGRSTVVAARRSPSVRTLGVARPWRAVGLATFVAALMTVPWVRAGARVMPWRLAPPTPAADRFFAEALPRWNDAHAARDLYGKNVGMESDALLREASALDPGLGRSVVELVRAAGQPGGTPARWELAAFRVNEASRVAGLPYYVDPTEMVVRRDGAHWLRLDTYRVESATVVRVDERTFRIVELRALLPRRTSSRTLGLSRDSEPTAVVMLDAVDRYVGDLKQLAEREPPRCARARSANPRQEAALQRCGALLRTEARSSDLTRELRLAVARHELQHQIDGPSPPVVASLARHARHDGLALPPRINREVSAYLAEMASPRGSPRFSLVRLLRLSVIDSRQVDGAAARIVLGLLAGREVDSGGAEDAFLALAPLGVDELRRRARDTWRRELGSELSEPAASSDR
jgi:hypothetical protein